MSSIEERRNEATGEMRYRVRFRLDGKNKAIPFLTRKDAEAWRGLLDSVGATRALEAIRAPVPNTSGRTVAEQVANHIAHLTGISDGTRRRYTGYLDRRIVGDPLGALPLSLATRDDFAAWVNRLAATVVGKNSDGTDKLMSAKTITNHHSVVSDAMRSAVRAGLIPANHAEGIRIASPDEDDADEMTHLTFPEVWAFIAATPEHWQPMVTFMFGTGTRWQEASALKVQDVDLDRLQARVVRAWKDTGGNGHQLGKPKSKRSRRTIVYGTSVADAIRPLVEGRPADAFVFTNTRGGPVRRTNFSEQAWAPGRHVVAGDVPEVVKPARGRSKTVWKDGPGKRPTPHDARHTYASLQIARGKSLAFIQRQLGHESITTTTDIYGHLQTEDLRTLADVIDVEDALEVAPPKEISN